MVKPMTKTEWMSWLEKAWDEAQQREWVGLTEHEVVMIGYQSNGNECVAARLAEANLKEKNS